MMVPCLCTSVNPHTEPQHSTNKYGFTPHRRVKPSDVNLIYVESFLTVVNIETQHHSEWLDLCQLFHVVPHHDGFPRLFLCVLGMVLISVGSLL